jgi:hypothetical protein
MLIGRYGFLVAEVFVIAVIVVLIRKRHPDLVLIIWYLFFLAFFVTWFFTDAAVALNAIGKAGEPLTSIGHFLRDICLPFIFDLNTETNILFAAAALVVFPQLLTWVICGAAGSATAPIWISGSLDLVLLSLAKSYTVAGGALIAFTWRCVDRNWTFYQDIVPPDMRNVPVIGKVDFSNWLPNSNLDELGAITWGVFFLYSAFFFLSMFAAARAVQEVSNLPTHSLLACIKSSYAVGTTWPGKRASNSRDARTALRSL